MTKTECGAESQALLQCDKCFYKKRRDKTMTTEDSAIILTLLLTTLVPLSLPLSQKLWKFLSWVSLVVLARLPQAPEPNQDIYLSWSFYSEAEPGVTGTDSAGEAGWGTTTTFCELLFPGLHSAAAFTSLCKHGQGLPGLLLKEIRRGKACLKLREHSEQSVISSNNGLDSSQCIFITHCNLWYIWMGNSHNWVDQKSHGLWYLSSGSKVAAARH